MTRFGADLRRERSERGITQQKLVEMADLNIWMNVRLQTWFPYHVQIALNGREWLRRRVEARHMDVLRQGNKFLHIEGYSLAQRFLNQQLTTALHAMLSASTEQLLDMAA